MKVPDGGSIQRVKAFATDSKQMLKVLDTDAKRRLTPGRSWRYV